jgi:hypothetical protein
LPYKVVTGNLKDEVNESKALKPGEQKPSNGGQDGVQSRLLTCSVGELQPHPSYARHNISVQGSKLATLAELGDLAFQCPLLITPDRFIIDGYGRWELAKRKGRPTLQCLEYDLTQEQALQWLIQTHHASEGLNDFVRIELALDLELHFQEKARLNRQAGGRCKGLSKLTEAERADSRREVARLAHVSVGNVHKVKHIRADACSSLQEAARTREVSINLADKWSYEPVAEQQEYLRLRRIQRGIRKKARQLVASHLAEISPSKADKRVFKMSDLVRLVNHLATIAPEQSNELGPIEVILVSGPGRTIFITEELIQALRTQHEVLTK